MEKFEALRMKDEIDNEDVLVRYLLGQLSDDEQQQIEQRAFDDDEFYSAVTGSRGRPAVRLRAGDASLAQRELFEKRFLIFADERKRVTLARDIIAGASAGPGRRCPGHGLDPRSS